jgi:hypothetical protein
MQNAANWKDPSEGETMSLLKDSEKLHPQLNRVQLLALAVGVVGLLIMIVGLFLDREQFFQSYLLGYIFWALTALGSLSILMIHHVAGGKWGVMIQRLLEGGAMTLPLMALLFIPIIIGIPTLYEWADPEHVAHDPLLLAKSPYLNVPFFILRTVIYFVIWIGIAYLLRRWSTKLDQDPNNHALKSRLRTLSAPGILIYGLTITFASVDWMMSLEPHWFSTIYGMMFGISGFTIAFAFVILWLMPLVKSKPWAGIIETEQISDLGSWLFAGVFLWAYLSFSQFLIIWSANLPEEIPWYLNRQEGGWQYLAGALIVIGFFLPFFVLLARGTKRYPKRVLRMGALVFVMQILFVIFLIVPAFSPGRFSIHLLDLAAIIGIGGVWMTAFVWLIKRQSLIPMYDPRAVTHETQEAPSHVH